MRGRMRTVCAADPKNKFGELADVARATPVAITKYDRAILVVLAIEEYERLARLGASIAPPEAPTDESAH